MYYNNILEVIGNTPLVKINKLNPNKRVLMLAKLESFNPGGSIKDRIGFHMIQDAIKRNKLKKDGFIVEATGAGNTGIGLAIAATVLGYKTVLTIPDKVSEEKRNLLKAFGSKLVIAPTAVPPEDERSYYKVADKLAKDIHSSYQPDQYSNPSNPQAHYKTTGPEIWQQTDGQVTHVIITIGTGGTISGIGKFLKEKNPHIKIIGVDHVGSVFLEYFRSGKIPKALKSFRTEGFGEDFVPKTMDFSVVDEVYEVDDKECFLMARDITSKEAILAGSSSGGALIVARKIARKLKKGVIVVVFPDNGRNYLTKFYSDDWMREYGYLEDNDNNILPLLNKKLHLITIQADASPKEAINLMRKYNISQLPVLDGKKLVGTICERILMQKMYGSLKVPMSVEEIMDKDFITLPARASLSQLGNALVKKEMVIIVEKSGKPVDVLTRIDLLAHLKGV